MTNRLEDQFRDNIGDYSGIQVQAWDENGQLTTGDVRVSMQSLHPTAKNSIRYILSVPVKAKSLRLSMNKYGAYSSNGSTISELNFFEYDSLEQDVYGLYADDMHVTLTEGTMQAEIIELEERANTIDTVSNEYHPKKTVLLSELEFAEKLLADSTIGDIMDLRWEVTKSGGVSGIKFNGGLCALQPLGYVAQVGSTVNIYVGQKGKNVGAALPLRLVFTQYHPESGAWRSGEIALYQGKNEITIPKINSLDYEQGGSLYIVHTDPGGVKANPVQIRVSGATKIPKLDLYRPVGEARRTVDETAWKAAIREYVEELVTYVGNLEASHEEHKEAVEYEYDETNCFLNSTEISLDNVLISVPAKQILSGLVSKAGSSTDIDALTNQMYDTAVAMNQMLELFYKERGLNPTYTYGYQGTPTGRFNIRYHRMFAGAFMYAGGLHLGIEYGSVPGLAAGTPVTADEKGRRTGGQMFGWGIAHEMGHNADGSNFSFAEITNNIWAQFEKSWDTAETTRIPYEKVYKHVTSNTVGKPSSVFASLGMYWQLHLAYDKNGVHYDYYKDDFSNAAYETMLQNEFFARYYAIRREWNRAPKPNGIGLTEGTTEQNIMRTACAAAEKDLTDFFRAWGYEVDSVTAAYAGQFDKETRKIQYLNDAAHEYTLENPDPETGGMSSTSVDVALEQGTGINARKVTLTMSLPAETNMDAVLGYEILRNGKPAAFVMPSKTEDGDYAAETVYEDIIETENNRVMIYEVVAYDNYLNATEKNTQAPIKIRHEGELPRDNWEITTNTVSNAGVLTVYDGTKVTEGNCYQDAATGEDVVYTLDKDVRYLSKETGELLYTETAAARMLDGDKETGYEGTAPSGTASITIALGGRQEVTALAFDGGSTQPWKFLLEYSTNGVNFTRITGFETNTTQDGSPVLYFAQNKNIKSYKATHIRITAPTNVKTIGIKELRLLSPSGDNVDIGVSMVDEENGKETWNTENAIGKLAEDYQLDENNTIPADSFIVTGKYTGNAAYNVVKLYNENHIMHDESNENKRNSIVNGYQTFFAEMPDSGSIVNVKDGTWIYWLEPLEGENAGKYGLRGAGENGADVVVELPTKVYAELYRVDDAMTLAGERLVSDTFTVDVPEELPIISLKGIGSETEGTQPEESGEETQTQAE